MAFMDDITPINVMDKVERPKPRKEDVIPEVKAYTVEEARKILACLEQEPFQWQVIMRLYLDSGCRRGELAGLRWKSVDFEKSEITIESNLQYTPARGVYSTNPKGKKCRTIDIDPSIMELMRELKASQTVKTFDDYCFTNEQGQPLHPQTPTRYMKSFGKRYGILNLHPHALRHTAASIGATVADIGSVSEKLGHTNKSTTLDMYVESNPEAIKKANEAYRKALYQRDEETALQKEIL
jgi:integrase